MLSNFIYVLTGFTAGVIGTIIGAGGGFLVVPYLLLARHFSPQLAVGTSLTMVFFNALSGTYAYAKQKRIDYNTAWKFALATIPGSIAGAYAAQFMVGRTFRVTFALFITAVAVNILYRSFNNKAAAASNNESLNQGSGASTKSRVTRILTDAYGKTYHISYDVRIGIITSFGVGFISSILGIGGGLIHVPLMIYVLGFPAHMATATSHLVLTISSLVGASSHLYFGDVQIKAAVLLAIGAILGAQIGARLARKVKEKFIIRLLAVALFFLAFRLLFG